MYEIALKDFRGFHDIDFIEIRPITLLIGENSAGKTSFLAALKFMLDMIRGEKETSFNSDPFQLGTFEQIAHFRGGKAGRAKEFGLKLRSAVGRARQERLKYSGNVTLSVSFANFDSQSAITEIGIYSDAENLNLKMSMNNVNINYTSQYGESYSIEEMKGFMRAYRGDLARHWPFLMRELRFIVKRSIDDRQKTLFKEDTSARVAFLADLAEALSLKFYGNVEATSAIRTKPRRTYTPTAEQRDGEGSHVPFEMAKLFRSNNKDAWKSIKESIDKFGSESDMFKQIGIKSFGNTASDPFQIQFSLDGPKTNIVDLGYGNSQVLPILYTVATASRGSKFLIQQPEVHLHPKAQAALGSYFVESFSKERKEFILETHSDFIVDRVRQAVQNKLLKPDDVSIFFFERKRLENIIHSIDIDEHGVPIDPPESYRAFFGQEQMRNLGI